MNESRPSAHARGYDSKWAKARAAYLRKHPLCADCQRRGLIVQATCVDHIKPHLGDKALFWDSSNWQSLCASCHSRKTSKEESWNKGKKIRVTAECGVDGVPTDPNHHWGKR